MTTPVCENDETMSVTQNVRKENRALFLFMLVPFLSFMITCVGTVTTLMGSTIPADTFGLTNLVVTRMFTARHRVLAALSPALDPASGSQSWARCRPCSAQRWQSSWVTSPPAVDHT